MITMRRSENQTSWSMNNQRWRSHTGKFLPKCREVYAWTTPMKYVIFCMVNYPRILMLLRLTLQVIDGFIWRWIQWVTSISSQQANVYAIALLPHPDTHGPWIVDSNASNHIYGYKSFWSKYCLFTISSQLFTLAKVQGKKLENRMQ